MNSKFQLLKSRYARLAKGKLDESKIRIWRDKNPEKAGRSDAATQLSTSPVSSVRAADIPPSKAGISTAAHPVMAYPPSATNEQTIQQEATDPGAGGSASQGWRPEGAAPRGRAPLSTTTGAGGSSYKESAREITQAGAPAQHSGKTPQAAFAKDPDEKQQYRDEAYGYGATKVDPENVRPHAAPKHAQNTVAGLAGDYDRADDPKFTGDPVGYIMNTTQQAARFLNRLPRMKPHEENVAAQSARMAGAAKKVWDRRKEIQEAWTHGATMFRPGTTPQVPLTGHTHATEGMTPEQVAQQNPDLVQVAEAGATPEAQKFAREWPKGSHNILSGDNLKRLQPEAGDYSGSFMNMMNTVEQNKNANLIANLARKPVDRMKPLPVERMPIKEIGQEQTSKTPTTGMERAGFKLHFHEHAPLPTLNQSEFSAEQSKDPDFKAKLVQADQEKDSALSALAGVHSHLSDAMMAHATGKSSDYAAHMQKAGMVAKNVLPARITDTQEHRNALGLLQQIPDLLDMAQKFPHSATKEGEHTHRDAIHAIQNHLHRHGEELRSTGAAFKENHVHRTDPKSIISQQNIPGEQLQTEQEFQAERPLSPRIKTETGRPFAIQDAPDPENEYKAMHSKLMKPRNNTIANEFADYMHRNVVRPFTHGSEAPELFSESFLDSVPLTTMHNHFHPKDNTQLGGKPIRQFVQDMSTKIINHGLSSMPKAEHDQFIALNEKYDRGDSMTQDELSNWSNLQKRIKEVGMNKIAAAGHATKKELDHFKAANAAAANKQYREDYEGEDSALSIKHQADDIAENAHLNPAEANKQLRELYKRLPPSEQTRFQHDPSTRLVSHNSKAVMGNSRTRSAVRRHIETLRGKLASALTANIKPTEMKVTPKKDTEKSMPTTHERLNKCKDSYGKIKDRLNKAVVPTGKYVRQADGTLLLVDTVSTPAQQQRKTVEEAQKPKPTLPTPTSAPKPVQPKTPDQPPAPPPVPKNLGQQAQKIRADAAMSAFSYKPKKG
jgi:hypothetical protein